MLENAITTFKYVLENYGLQAAFLLLIFVRDCWLFWTQNKQITSLQNEIKGVVIDAWVRQSLIGIDLVTADARIVTYTPTHRQSSASGGRVRLVLTPQSIPWLTRCQVCGDPADDAVCAGCGGAA